MQDTDNVSKKILDDANKERQKILDDAKEKAKTIIDEAQNRRKKILEEGKIRAEERYKEVYNLELSRAKSELNQKLLLQKLNYIEKVIKGIKERLKKLSREDYKEFFASSIKNSNIKDGIYEIGYEEKNIDDETVESLASQLDGVRLKKSGHRPKFKNGVKISSGKVDYFISPEAIIEAKEDDIRMEVAHILFNRKED